VRRLLRIAIALIGLLWPALCLGADQLPRSVLILSQGLPGGPWPSAVHQAIRTTLLGNGTAPVVDYIEELDLGRFGSPEYEQPLRGYLREKLQEQLVAQGNFTPIIFITAVPDERTQAMAIKAGAAGFLRKPFKAMFDRPPQRGSQGPHLRD
jgi:hypothetical protein